MHTYTHQHKKPVYTTLRSDKIRQNSMQVLTGIAFFTVFRTRNYDHATYANNLSIKT